ncbi:Cytochrome P450, 11, subfamily C, polypeptide 1 [Balamuthia mandrillaris]
MDYKPHHLPEEEAQEKRLESELKHRHDKPLFKVGLDPSHLLHSEDTTQEERQAEREGFHHAKLPPGSFGKPLVGQNLSLIRDGYDFFLRKSHAPESGRYTPLFRAHLMGERAIVIAGAKEAKLFYDENLVTRAGGYAKQLTKYFFGANTMVTMDGEDHRCRKAQVLASFDVAHLRRYLVLYGSILDKYLQRWKERSSQGGTIKCSEQFIQMDTELAMAYVLGIHDPPLTEVEKRATQLVHIMEIIGAAIFPVEVPGFRQSKAGKARRKLSKWLMGLVKETKRRLDEGQEVEDCFLKSIVTGTDIEGKHFPEEVQVEELINALRPTMLVGYLQTFMLHALHEYPQVVESVSQELNNLLSDYSQRNRNDETGHSFYKDSDFLEGMNYCECFIREVKRFYPCIPLLSARVKKSFENDGYYFPKDYLMVLAIHAIHRDPRVWDEPDRFDPLRWERKENEREDPLFTLVQHGGGDVKQTHRCAGEHLATLMMKATAARLIRDFEWDWPTQRFTIYNDEMPTLPVDGMLIANFRERK